MTKLFVKKLHYRYLCNYFYLANFCNNLKTNEIPDNTDQKSFDLRVINFIHSFIQAQSQTQTQGNKYLEALSTQVQIQRWKHFDLSVCVCIDEDSSYFLFLVLVPALMFASVVKTGLKGTKKNTFETPSFFLCISHAPQRLSPKF